MCIVCVCCSGDELGSKWSVIVGVENVTGMKMASVALMRGAAGKFAGQQGVWRVGV